MYATWLRIARGIELVAFKSALELQRVIMGTVSKLIFLGDKTSWLELPPLQVARKLLREAVQRAGNASGLLTVLVVSSILAALFQGVLCRIQNCSPDGLFRIFFRRKGSLRKTWSWCRRIEWENQRVLITGGSSGIGFELARLLSQGTSALGPPKRITIVGRNELKLESAKSALLRARAARSRDEDASGLPDIETIQADVSTPAGISRVFRNRRHNYDVIICCAGGALPGYFEEFTAEEFRAQMDTNYLSAALVAQAAFREWKRESLEEVVTEYNVRHGETCIQVPPPLRRLRHIVFFSSMAAFAAIFGYSAYAPAKYALRGLAEALAYEGRPFGIGISVVFPPDTLTPGFDSENRRKPPATMACSEISTGAALSASKVARIALQGITERKYWITIGLDGYFLGALSAGFSPCGFGLFSVLLMPILRCIVPYYVVRYHRIIARDTERRLREELRQSL
jgi:3-dehydrosphinganine reductase